MPDVRNCKKCGRVFSYMGGAPICPACKEADEEDFKRIKNYLYDNPGASLTQVSLELDISVEKIRRFLKDGRLEILSEEGNMFLECEICGKSIKSGRYCSNCEKDLSEELKYAAGQLRGGLNSVNEAGRKAVGLRYLNKEDNKKL